MVYFLGVDGGGSTTVAALADQTGQLVGLGKGGPGNFQTVGLERARAEVKKSISGALQAAGVEPSSVAGAYFGMSGADRPRDFELVRELLAPVVPGSARWSLENDAVLGLWAGTTQGVGIGVVCGTGTNVVGLNAQGKRVQVGGLGRIFGDAAGGRYLGEEALARSQRAKEGRGKPTLLYERLCRHYQVEDLLDLMDWLYQGQNLRLAELAPLVFQAAAEGDEVAQELLVEMGRELGASTLAAARQLFAPGESLKVVGVGSVFQKAELSLIYQEFSAVLQASEFTVEPQILHTEPVVGAIYGACAQVGFRVDSQFKDRLERSLAEHLEGK